MAKSDFLENKLIDQVFRGMAYTFPTTLYFALYTGAPSDAGGGTEVSGTGYARVAVVPNTTNFRNTQNSGTGASTGTSGTTSNLTAITFGTPGAAWGLITHIGIFDASSGGNLLYQAALSATKNVNNGDPAPSFPAGSLTITEA